MSTNTRMVSQNRARANTRAFRKLDDVVRDEANHMDIKGLKEGGTTIQLVGTDDGCRTGSAS